MFGCGNNSDPLTIHFEGKHVSLSSDAYSLMAAFADDQQQPTNYVLLQRTVNPSEQDIDLGQDQVHLEVNDQSRSKYGAIDKCVLDGKELQISLKDNAALDLGIERHIRIGLNEAGIRSQELAGFLEKLFSGIGGFSRR